MSKKTKMVRIYTSDAIPLEGAAGVLRVSIAEVLSRLMSGELTVEQIRQLESARTEVVKSLELDEEKSEDEIAVVA